LQDYIENQVFSNIDDIDFEGRSFLECRFENIDFTEVKLSSLRFLECSFNKCNLSNSSLTNTTFRDVSFNECKLIGLNWSSCHSVSQLEIKESILDYGVFQNMVLKNAIFSKCSIKEADFSQSQLNDSSFSDSDLMRSHFIGSNLSGCDFRGAINYVIDIESCKLKKAKFSSPEVLGLLSNLDILIDR